MVKAQRGADDDRGRWMVPCVAAVCFGCGGSVGRRRACSEAARCSEREIRAVADLTVRPKGKIVIGGCWSVCRCV